MEVRAEIQVKDVMSSPVMTVKAEDSLLSVANLMREKKIGSVIVVDSQGKPVGIITERDLVIRAMAKNTLPSMMTAQEAMSTPLVTVDPSEDLNEAARKLGRLGIRRLAVMDQGRLVGIISSKDILAVTPELIEIVAEKAKIMGEIDERPPMAGYCDSCGGWSETLEETEGSFLCEECRIELGAEE